MLFLYYSWRSFFNFSSAWFESTTACAIFSHYFRLHRSPCHLDLFALCYSFRAPQYFGFCNRFPKFGSWSHASRFSWVHGWRLIQRDYDSCLEELDLWMIRLSNIHYSLITEGWWSKWEGREGSHLINSIVLSYEGREKEWNLGEGVCKSETLHQERNRA